MTLEDDLDGRQPEDVLQWKTPFDGILSMTEDDIRWNNTLHER